MEDVVKHLKLVPLFSSLSQRQLKGLARDFKERRVPSGTSLVKQGHMSGVDFFVIVEGDASVTVNGTEVGRRRGSSFPSFSSVKRFGIFIPPAAQ